MDHLGVQLCTGKQEELWRKSLQNVPSSTTTGAGGVLITKHLATRSKIIYPPNKQFTDWSQNNFNQVEIKQEPDLEDESGGKSQIYQRVTYIKPQTVVRDNATADILSQNFDDHNYKKRRLNFVVDLSKSSQKAEHDPTSSRTKLDKNLSEFENPENSVIVESVKKSNISPEAEFLPENSSVTTLIIDNNTCQDLNPANIIIIDPKQLAPVDREPRISSKKCYTNMPGDVKTEEEAKVIAAPYIGKVDSKPPKYKCLFTADCTYINARLSMTQSHVYKHLDIYTYQCNYCQMKCRLETNFEKHLNTHGVTRRREKIGQYIYLDTDKNPLSVTNNSNSATASGVEIINISQTTPSSSSLTPTASLAAISIEEGSSRGISPSDSELLRGKKLTSENPLEQTKSVNNLPVISRDKNEATENYTKSPYVTLDTHQNYTKKVIGFIFKLDR